MIKDMPKVSLVIPAFNEEKYIEKTLQAVLNQDYTDFELIVVDNGSTDRTREIVGKFPQVKLLSEAKKGPNAARETGRKHATGEIIGTLDADTILPKHWVGRGVSYFKKNRIVAVTGPYDFYDGGLVFRVTASIVQIIFFSLAHMVNQYILKKGAIVTGGNVLIRAHTLENIGGFNTDISFYGDDTDTAMRLFRLGEIIYSPALIVKSSARRFKGMGHIQTFWIYIQNHFLMLRKKKATSHSDSSPR